MLLKSGVTSPGLGIVARDDRLDWYYSSEIPVKALGGIMCRIVVVDYDEDEAKEEFHVAIRNFLSIDQAALNEAEPFIFRYYEDVNSDWEPGDDEYVRIDSPSEIWRHIQLGNQPIVSRRAYRDKQIYVSLECKCGWEPEHGLQMVFKNGLRVTKLGRYDGHLSNADAYANDELEDVVYR